MASNNPIGFKIHKSLSIKNIFVWYHCTISYLILIFVMDSCPYLHRRLKWSPYKNSQENTAIESSVCWRLPTLQRIRNQIENRISLHNQSHYCLDWPRSSICGNSLLFGFNNKCLYIHKNINENHTVNWIIFTCWKNIGFLIFKICGVLKNYRDWNCIHLSEINNWWNHLYPIKIGTLLYPFPILNVKSIMEIGSII